MDWKVTHMDIKEVQKKLLNLMIELDKICLEHNISYTLHGGSLLGAKMMILFMFMAI